MRATVHSSSGRMAIDWTPRLVLQSLCVFVLAGLAEIGGGWLVWQTIREKRAWYLALLGACSCVLAARETRACVTRALACTRAGCLLLSAYGFIPTLSPEGANFGRVYAVYGGMFILLSYAFGWAVDGDRPDTGDWIGATVAVAGVMVAWFWPRSNASSEPLPLPSESTTG